MLGVSFHPCAFVDCVQAVAVKLRSQMCVLLTLWRCYQIQPWYMSFPADDDRTVPQTVLSLLASKTWTTKSSSLRVKCGKQLCFLIVAKAKMWEVFPHFTLSDGEKHYVCRCRTAGKKSLVSCDSMLAIDQQSKHGPSRISNSMWHLKRKHVDQLSPNGSSLIPGGSKCNFESKSLYALGCTFFKITQIFKLCKCYHRKEHYPAKEFQLTSLI